MKEYKLHELLNIVSSATGIPHYEIIGKKRKVEYVMARHLFRNIARKQGYILSDIGKVSLNTADHTTVLHSIKLCESLAKYNDFAIIELIKDVALQYPELVGHLLSIPRRVSGQTCNFSHFKINRFSYDN